MTRPKNNEVAREISNGFCLSFFDRRELFKQITAAIDQAVERDLKWAREQLTILCEDTEDKCLETAFDRGRSYEAKGIRRTMFEVIGERLATAQAIRTDSKDGKQ